MGEFDKDIRDLFETYEPSVDIEEIWQGVEQKLNKKKRRGTYLWLLIPLAILVLSGFLYLGLNKQKSLDSNQIKNTLSVISGSNYGNTLAVNVMKDETINNQQISISKTGDENSNTNQKLESSKMERKSGSHLVNNESTIQNKNNLISNKYIVTKNEISNSISNSDSKIDEDFNIPTSLSPDRYFSVFVIPVKNIDIFKVVTEPEFAFSVQPIAYNKPNKVKHINNLDKSISLGLGLALVDKILNVNTIGFEQYKNKRELTEKYLESFGGNFAYQLKHNSGFFANIGFRYTQIDEKFSSIDSTDILTTGTGIIDQIYLPDGSIIENRGSKEIIEHKTWNKLKYNYYRFVDIPIAIGYGYHIGNLKYEISIGVAYNILFAKKAQIIGVYDYPVDVNEDGKIFRKTAGTSLISDIKFLYPYRNFDLFIAPNLRYNISRLTLPEYPLTQKYLNYGIDFGIKMKL